MRPSVCGNSTTSANTRPIGACRALKSSGRTDDPGYVFGRTSLIFGALVFLFAGHPAQAEIYRWTDGQGKVHFTSDLSKVPARYRGQSAAGVPKRTINIINQSQPAAAPKPATSGKGDRWDAMRPRVAPKLAPGFLEDLKKQTQRPAPTLSRELAVPKVGPRPVLRPALKDSEPRKYQYDCPDRLMDQGGTNQVLMGRCRRSRTVAWDAWNARQKQGSNP